MYGDTEPEDAYDASDPPKVRLRNIIRRLALLRSDVDYVFGERHELRLREAIDDLETLIGDVDG